jgi:phage tail protein X
MTAQYIAREGDTLDYIAWAQYGSVTPSILAAMLAANYGLADLGPVLPVGTLVALPVIDVKTEVAATGEVSLWS